ncbi:hypothetical protein [Halovenus salina]|uniref:hypothetical protein n=1 Tax=Halovenus salina TaxID=1510225 RepID=UPI002260BB4C|nr:hypothetical protein [Halovenus salina]
MAGFFVALAVGIVTFVAGSYLIYKGIEPLYWTTVVLRSTTASVREAKNTDGIVELEGEAVRTDGQVESPFTATACLAYGCKIEQYRSGSSNTGGRWKTIYSDRDGVPFRFEDDTGGVEVDPATATLFFASRDTIDVGWGSTPGEQIASYQRRRNIERVGEDKPRRYIEQRVAAGDRIHVYGPITNRPITTMANAFNAPVRRGNDPQWFLLTDTDRAATVRRLLKPILMTILGILAFLFGLRILGSFVLQFVLYIIG